MGHPMPMRASWFPLLALSLLISGALPAEAHGRVCVKGTEAREIPAGGGNCASTDDLQFALGWTAEPAVTGQKNGLFLGVSWPGNTTAVTNLTTLRAEYEFGGRVFPLVLRGMSGNPGVYTDDVIPTRPGEYAVRVTGTVHGFPVNWTEHPEEVTPASDLEFPEVPEDPEGLRAEVKSLRQDVTALRAEVQALKAQPSRNGMVTPEPGATTPGFDGAAAVVAFVAALAWVGLRRRPGRV